jgi:hypothetical protein
VFYAAPCFKQQPAFLMQFPALNNSLLYETAGLMKFIALSNSLLYETA